MLLGESRMFGGRTLQSHLEAAPNYIAL
jgi:hypothetical protein